MLQELALALHIAPGVLALALGPLAVYAAKRSGPGTRLDGAYHLAVLAVCASAALLAALDWSRLWWFLPIAAGSYGLALLGYAAGRRDRLRLYVHGQGGSYIALVTALLVVSVGSPVAWVAPTLIGSPLIQLIARRLASRPTHGEVGTCTRSLLGT